MWKHHGNATKFIAFTVFLYFPFFRTFLSPSSFSVDWFYFPISDLQWIESIRLVRVRVKQIVWLWYLIGNRKSDCITIHFDECEELTEYINDNTQSCSYVLLIHIRNKKVHGIGPLKKVKTHLIIKYWPSVGECIRIKTMRTIKRKEIPFSCESDEEKRRKKCDEPIKKLNIRFIAL